MPRYKIKVDGFDIETITRPFPLKDWEIDRLRYRWAEANAISDRGVKLVRISELTGKQER